MENLAPKYISVQDYLTLERSSEGKHEYFSGELFNMAGATKNHNLIVSNLIMTLGMRFKGQPCVVYPSDMKIAIDEHKHFVYPDVSIVCNGSKFLDKSEDVLLNPQVIIEVLSKSTETYDRGKKFAAYRNLPSMQDYVLIASEYRSIEVFSKDSEHRWYFSDSLPQSEAFIQSLATPLLHDDVYDKIVFDD